MTTFIFLLTVWSSAEGGTLVYVEDHNLSGEDCIARMMQQYERDPEMKLGIPSCEIDMGD